MLIPYLFHWASPITISYLYHALCLQFLLKISKSVGASGILSLPVEVTRKATMRITASVS